MNSQPPADDLIARLLHGEAAGDDLVALAALAGGDPGLTRRITGELAFSELIRQALSDSQVDPGRSFEADLASAGLSVAELVTRVRDADATPFECDRLAAHLWEFPAEAATLRRTLAEDEWLRAAVSESKGGDAFVASLETRMWAETRRDRFVDEFAKRLDRELVPVEDTADKVVAFPGAWTTTVLKMAALAAAIGLGAFFAAQVAAGRLSGQSPLATVVKATPDVRWNEEASPRDDGTLRPGVYELRSGVVSMKLATGGELTVEGPARFEVSEEAGTFVHAGIALARAPEDDGGIRLCSRGLSIADPVRLVGIDARTEDATEAVVFNGDGGICLAGSDKCRDLSRFEAVKADHVREKLVDVPYNPRAFSKAWELAAGVEHTAGPVSIELPGPVLSAVGAEEGEVRVYLENESFRPRSTLEVDRVVTGSFALAEPNPGESLAAGGELRSYLLQVPASGGSEELETSLTFDHPVVGVIFSSDRLDESDASVGAELRDEDSGSTRRGMESGEDEILLSEDRRTLNLRLKGGGDHPEQMRILVALR